MTELAVQKEVITSAPVHQCAYRLTADSGVGAVVLCNAEGACDLPDLLDDILGTVFLG